MREIKFRAWYKRTQTMLPVKVLKLTKYGWIADKSHFNYVPNTNVIGRDVELMQYTGLKDKNGKEGYFDDLVKWGKSTYQVVWDSDEGVAWLSKVDGEEVWTKLRIHLIKQGEVIGNIYENPELLRK